MAVVAARAPTTTRSIASCTAALTITGTFAPGQAAPLNPDGSTYEGCWPIGTWTFSATWSLG